MPRRSWWLGVLLVALVIRLLSLQWDAGTPPSPHPDERRVASVAEGLDGWSSDPGFYAYGSLHFFAVRATARMLGFEPRWGGLIASGRLLSLLASLAALALGMWMADRAWGRRTARLFGWMALWVPLDQQVSHYATVEAHHAFWVVSALAALFQFGRTRRWRWALVSGAAIGASLAVKISSLALAGPAALALAWVVLRSRRPAALAGALPLGVGVFAAFVLGQPWAFAGGRWWSWSFNPRFIAGVGEQVAMVAGTLDFPYVRVYASTIPVLYSLRELMLWGFGPALVVAGIIGSLAGLRILLRRRLRWVSGRGSDGLFLVLLLLAWILPMALRLSTLQVKFLRYWSPLMVPIALMAAWWLGRLRGRTGRRWTIAVLGGTALWGLAYLWAFAQPHPFATAAPWLRSVVGREDRVAWEHWDEHLANIGGESLTLASYDLPDDDAKVESWCSTLARADWVVLTSNRVRRTVLANEDRYPRTARLYRLLLAGEAGFEVATTISRGPRLAGWRAPVQRADESFVNYDFPMVVVFRRMETIDFAELTRRSTMTAPALDHLGAAELDREFLAHAGSVAPTPSEGSQVVGVGLWLAFFAVMTASWWILVLPWFRSWPDAGVGLAVPTGWIVSSWLVWMASKLGMPIGEATVSLAVGLMALGAVAAGWRRRAAIRGLLVTRRSGIRMVGCTVLGVFLLFLLVRLFNPAISWGEKPMDFSFFNAFARADHWPPGEPWMAGEPLHYYYFGSVLSAVPTLVTGVDTAVAYNLMCASVPALAWAPLAGLGLLVARRRRRALFAVLPALVLLAGNLAWPWLLRLAEAGRWFDLWWATSRVVPGYAITEFPLWTALFADLHAHFLAMPVMLTAGIWAWIVVRMPDGRWIGPALVCALSAAVLAATNPWDLPLFAGTLLMAVVAVGARPTASLGRLGAAGAVSVIAAAPFVFEMTAWLGGDGGVGGRPLLYPTTGDFAPWWAVARHFGLFLIPMAVGSLFRPIRDLGMTVVLSVVGAAAGVLVFHSSGAALALGLAAWFLTMVRWAPDRWQATAWVLAGTGLLFVAGIEAVTVMDRMNSVFKTYNGVWLSLGIACGILILRAGRPALSAMAVPLAALGLIASVNLVLGIGQGCLQPRTVSPKPTLDGRAFLSRDRSNAFLIRALNGAGRSGEVVAEAIGPSYGPYTRIAMHTGLPTVVGWEWHLRQRGQNLEAIEARKRDLEVLYSPGDPLIRNAVLKRYGVAWIVLGDLERERYRLTRSDPFSDVPGVVPWARQGSTRLYRFDPNPPGGGQSRAPAE